MTKRITDHKSFNSEKNCVLDFFLNKVGCSSKFVKLFSDWLMNIIIDFTFLRWYAHWGTSRQVTGLLIQYWSIFNFDLNVSAVFGLFWYFCYTSNSFARKLDHSWTGFIAFWESLVRMTKIEKVKMSCQTMCFFVFLMKFEKPTMF